MASDTAVDSAREFTFTHRDFERVCAMIHARAGIALAVSKRDMVYSRLSRRLRALKIDSFAEYLQRLADPADAEWEAFTNALTTNLTSFFREPHHFDTLKTLLRATPQRYPLLLWSAASSTGEEPYSMAIAACEAFETLNPPVRILASDLDTQVLASAERGVYALERIEQLEASRVKRYFLRGSGPQEGKCRVRDELRELVHFRPMNLLDAKWPLRGPYTAIFCRNVMIYFDKPTQRDVLARLVPLLSDDGLLFAGHSESFFHAADLVRPCGRTVYRRATA